MDTPLMRLVIEDIAEMHDWSFDESMKRFYESNVCLLLSDRETGIFTYSHCEIVDLFNEEITRQSTHTTSP